MPIDNAKDIVMLLLYASEDDRHRPGGITGRTRLQKLVYLAQLEGVLNCEEGMGFSFVPYKYGPFSKDLALAVDFLISKGFICEQLSDSETPIEDEDCAVDQEYLLPNDIEDTSCSYNEPSFQLSEKGINLAQTLYADLDNPEKERLSELRTRFGRLSLRQLLKYVYTHYPEGAERSEIRHLILDNQQV